MTDKDLILRTQQGDRAAFAELVDRYRDAVCGVAYHYLGNFDDVQDAAQEAFLQAYSSLPQLREPDKFGPWVRQITTNLCLQALRRKDNRNLPLDAAPEQSTEDDSRKSAVRLVVREALGKLSEKTRLTVALCYINGYSHDEVAQFLEVPLNTVRSRLRIAKKQLREEMIEMVHDVLHEDKPGDELMQAIMRDLEIAWDSVQKGSWQEALGHHEATLRLTEPESFAMDPEKNRQILLDALSKANLPGIDQSIIDERVRELSGLAPMDLAMRCRIDALGSEGHAYRQMRKWEEAVKWYKAALELAEKMRWPDMMAPGYEVIGEQYMVMEDLDTAAKYYRKAADTYARMEDTIRRAQCLWVSGSIWLDKGDVDAGTVLYQEALQCYQDAGITEGEVVCKAALGVVSEVGPETFPRLLCSASSCFVLAQNETAVSVVWHSGPFAKSCSKLPVTDVLAQLSYRPRVSVGHRAVGVDLVKSVNTMGDTWSYRSELIPQKALETVSSVESRSESVTVPAGSFDGCVLIEQVASADELPNYLPQSFRDKILDCYCGTRRAWFAPGVGLVQLHVLRGDGAEATIQLEDYHIEEPTSDYFPLTVGNTWTYGWAGVPDEYVAREKYRVYANQSDLWYLEHWMYAYKNQQQDSQNDS